MPIASAFDRLLGDAMAAGFGKMVTVEDLIGPLNEVERKRAPKRLWLGGDASIFELGTLVSVVGSRSPSPAGIRRTRRLARELVRRDVVVVSGLARGIDTVAHETAIDCGGSTVAVLATPLDRATPPDNSRLQQRIIRDHAAVTQFPPGAPILKMNFAIRNRTMALLSAATVIVEAGPNSGTRYQGWEALRLGRPLFIPESAVQSADIQWLEELRRNGAEVLDDDNIADALAVLHRSAAGGEIDDGQAQFVFPDRRMEQ